MIDQTLSKQTEELNAILEQWSAIRDAVIPFFKQMVADLETLRDTPEFKAFLVEYRKQETERRALHLRMWKRN